MDQRITEGELQESSSVLSAEGRVPNMASSGTNPEGAASLKEEASMMQDDDDPERLNCDNDRNPDLNLDLGTLEGLARALALDIESVFEFTDNLDDLLNPAAGQQHSHRSDDFDDDDDEDKAAEELRLKNAAILGKMNLLMRAAPAEQVEDKKDRDKREQEIKIEKPKREDYGIQVATLKNWQDLRDQRALEKEESRQEIAVARVRGFLDAMRMLTRLQAWWRMMTFKMEFKAFRNGRLAVKRKFFVGWRQYWAAEHMFLFHTLGKPFEAWAGEVESAKQLKEIVRQFFNLCVKRLRLTPQAVMAYFAPPTDDSVEISETDGMKIRRLILSKLFEGWKAEVRELRGMRFKASQILARTVRRSKGPMWVKEGVLICFHIWHRYSAVRNAYRREAPDPQFKNPHFPQWTKLLSSITLSRIHRKRAQEKGEHLTQLRAYKTWKLIMTMDKSKLLTPLQIAINHWNLKVWTKVFNGWSLHLRERGLIMRIRDKCFFAWKWWSPRKKRLRILKAQTIAWLALRQKRTVVNEMTSQCFDVVGRRAGVLRILRKNVNDRKVMICAYALMGFDSHVIMLDCWRRWTLWWKARRRWKLALWNYRFAYHETKMVAIFEAWRQFVDQKLNRPSTTRRPTTSLVAGGNVSVNLVIDETSLSSDGGGSRPETVASSFGPATAAIHGGVTCVPYSRLLPGIMERCTRMFSAAQRGNLDPFVSGNAFELFLQAICLSHSLKRKRMNKLLAPIIAAEKVAAEIEEAKRLERERLAQSSDEDDDEDGSLAESSIEGGDSIASLDDDEKAFQEHKQHVEAEKNKGMNVMENIADIVNVRMMRDEEFIKSDDESAVVEEEPEAALLAREAAAAEEEAKRLAELNELHKELTFDEMKELNEAKEYRALQNKLQHGLDVMDMRLVALAVQEGAEVTSSHIRQASKHFGDSHMPLFSLLLTNGLEYVAQRILKDDRDSEVMGCSSPLNAVLLSAHIDRWNQCNLTNREVGELTEDMTLSATTGSDYQATLMFRTCVVMVVKRKEDDVRESCKILPDHRTMEDEVQEQLKRKKLKRLQQVRKTLVDILYPGRVEYPVSSIEGSLASAGFGQNAWGTSDNASSASRSPVNAPGASSKAGLFAEDEGNAAAVVPWDSGSAPPTAGGGSLTGLDSGIRIDESGVVRGLTANTAAPAAPLFDEFGDSASLLANSLSQELAWMDVYEEVPPVVGVAPPTLELNIEWTKSLDIYSLLHEFTLMTNKLSTEARALREPYINRDLKLVEFGFMKQQRRDFLELRKAVRTPAQVQAEADKAAKAADKAKAKKVTRSKKIEKELRAELLREEQEEEEERLAQEALEASSVEVGSIDGNDAAEEESITANSKAEGKSPNGKNKKSKKDKKDKKAKKKKGKKSKKGKKGRQGKKKKRGAEDNVDVEEEPGDEDDERLTIFDPLFFQENYSEYVIREEPEELEDQYAEEIFDSRAVESTGGTILLEMYRPKFKKGNHDYIIGTSARAISSACHIPRRTLKMLKAEGIDVVEGMLNSGQDGGISQWVVASSLQDIAFCEHQAWSWLPPEWWDVHILVGRVQQESVIVNQMKDSITKIMSRDNYVKAEILDNRLDLQDYLKERRQYIVKISGKRRRKLSDDISEKQQLLNQIARNNNKIKEMRNTIKNTQTIIAQTDTLIANGNLEGAFKLLEVEVTQEELNEAAEDPDGKGKDMKRKLYKMAEAKEMELPMMEKTAEELVEKKKKLEMDSKLFDRLCQRGNVWLRNMAETEFNAMLDIQSIVIRMAKDEKKLDLGYGAQLRTLSIFRKHSRFLGEFNGLVDREQARLENEAVERDEYERNRPKTKADFRSKGGRGKFIVDLNVDPRKRYRYEGDLRSNSPTRRTGSPSRSRGTSPSHSRRGSPMRGRHDEGTGFQNSDDFGVLTKSDAFEPLTSPHIQGSSRIGLEGIEPRKLTEDEKLTALSALEDGNGPHVGTLDPNAVGVTNSVEQELADLIADQQLQNQLEGLEDAEKAAVLAHHDLRAKIFDDYWELIIPMRIGADDDPADSLGNSLALSDDMSLNSQEHKDHDSMDDPLGKTTRMWYQIGDEYLMGRKDHLNEDESEYDPLAGVTWHDKRMRLTDMEVGDDAWMLAKGKEMSVSMKVHGEAAAQAARKAKEKAASLQTEEEEAAEKKAKDAASAAVASTPSMNLLRGGMPMDEEKKPDEESGDQEKSDSPTKKKKKPKIQKAAEDPFINTGKVEIDRMKASLTRMMNGTTEFFDSAPVSVASLESNEDVDWDADFQAADYIKRAINAEKEGADTAPMSSPSNANSAMQAALKLGDGYPGQFPDDGSVPDENTFTSMEQQENHQRDVDQYMALLDENEPTIGNKDSNTTHDTTHLVAPAPVDSVQEMAPVDLALTDETPITTTEEMMTPSLVKAPEPQQQQDTTGTSRPSTKETSEGNLISGGQLDDDPHAGVDEKPAVVKDKEPMEKAKRPMSAPISDEDIDDEDDDAHSVDSKIKPISFVRVSQQQPAAADAAHLAKEASKSRGIIEVKRNAPKNNAHGDIQYEDGYLELPDVTGYVMEEHPQHYPDEPIVGNSNDDHTDYQVRNNAMEMQRRVVKSRDRADATPDAHDNAVAVLAGGKWSLIKPPSAGSLAGRNTDFKDSSMFQGLNMTGTSVKEVINDTLQNFTIDGLADHELLDIFSGGGSVRLGSALGFPEDHPSIVDSRTQREIQSASLSVASKPGSQAVGSVTDGLGGNSVTTYASLLDLVEAELDLPLSPKPKVKTKTPGTAPGGGTRGILAPVTSSNTNTKTKKKKGRKGKKRGKDKSGVQQAISPHSSAAGSSVAMAMPFPQRPTAQTIHPDDPSIFDGQGNGDGRNHATTIHSYADIKVKERTEAMKETRRERITSLSLAIFAQNVEQLLESRFAKATEERDRAWNRGFSRPPIIIDRGSLTTALHSSAESRKEMRAFVKAGLDLLHEEKYGNREAMNVTGANMPVEGTPKHTDTMNIVASGSVMALDWDSAFVGFDSSKVYTEVRDDVFTAPKDRRKTPGSAMNRPSTQSRRVGDKVLDPSKKREIAMNDVNTMMPSQRYDITTEAPDHKDKYYDGNKSYIVEKKRATSPDRREVMSPARRERLTQLQAVYMNMIDDDDDALEIAYAAVLGLTDVADLAFSSETKDAIMDDELSDAGDEDRGDMDGDDGYDYGEDGDDEDGNNDAELQEVAYSAMLESVAGVGEEKYTASDDDSSLQLLESTAQSSTHHMNIPNMQMQIEIPNSPIRPASQQQDAPVSVCGTYRVGFTESWIDDPMVRGPSSAVMSNPNANRPPKTPIISIGDLYSNNVPPPSMVLDDNTASSSSVSKSQMLARMLSKKNVSSSIDTAALELKGNAAVMPSLGVNATSSSSPLSKAPLVIPSESWSSNRYAEDFVVDASYGPADAGPMAVEASAVTLQTQNPQMSYSMSALPDDTAAHAVVTVEDKHQQHAGGQLKRGGKTTSGGRNVVPKKSNVGTSASMVNLNAKSSGNKFSKRQQDVDRTDKLHQVQLAMGTDYDWLDDDVELEIEKELRGMLGGVGGGEKIGFKNSSLGYSGLDSAYNIEKEREFLSETHGINIKKKKKSNNKKISLAGGQLLPPLKPSTPRVDEIGGTLNVAKERVGGTHKDGSNEEAAPSRKLRTKNKWVRDADFDSPRVSTGGGVGVSYMSKSMPDGSRLVGNARNTTNDNVNRNLKTQQFASSSREIWNNGDGRIGISESINEQLQAMVGDVVPIIPGGGGGTNFSLDGRSARSSFSSEVGDIGLITNPIDGYERYANMNMSIRLPSSEDVVLGTQEGAEDRGGELGLDSAR
jgi:hypothetical protein